MPSNGSLRTGPFITAIMLSLLREAHDSRRNGFARSYDRVVGTHPANDPDASADAPVPNHRPLPARFAGTGRTPRGNPRPTKCILLWRLLSFFGGYSGPTTPCMVGASAIMILSPYMGNFKAKGEGDILEGEISYSCSSDFGSAGFGVYFSKNGKPEVEDDFWYIDYPDPGGYFMKATTNVDGVEINGQVLPAGTSPGSGSCSFTIVVGPGKTIVIPPGAHWHTSASVSGFEGWKYKVNEEEGEMSAGTYVGPTTIGVAGSCSVDFTVIPPVVPPESLHEVIGLDQANYGDRSPIASRDFVYFQPTFFLLRTDVWTLA